MMRRITSAAALCLVLAACNDGPALTLPQALDTSKALAVTHGPLEETLLLYGRLEAVEAEKFLAPRTEMWSLSIRFLAPDGAMAKNGDVVVEFDNSAFVSRLSEMSLALEAAQSELERQKAASDAALAEREIALVRAEIALKKAEVEAAVPEDSYPLRVHQEKLLALEKAKSELARAIEAKANAKKASELDLKVRQIAAEQAKQQLEETQANLQALTLRAPRDGLVLIANHRRERRVYQVGDVAWPGNTIATLPNLAAYQFVAEMSDVDDGKVQVGMKARCFADAFPDKPIVGTVASISPVAQLDSPSSSRSHFTVVVSLPANPPVALRPGMSARAEVIQRSLASATLVPRNALVPVQDGYQVIEPSGTSHEVKIQFCSALACALKSELRAGLWLREVK